MIFKFKIHFLIALENTKSHIEIKSLFFKLNKNGSFRLTPKVYHEKNIQSKKNKNQKSDIGKKFRNWFLFNIQYEELMIYEKIGVLNPFLTSMALPIVSTITMVPLNLFRINEKKLQYEIVPDYNNLLFQFRLDTTASFRIIDLFIRLLKKGRKNIY